MYYGNATAADAQAASAVWDVDSVGVYHFNGSANDSSTPNQNGVTTSVTYSAGIVGQAATFDGITSGINVGSDASLDNVFASGGTISTWINPVGWGEGGFGRIVEKAANSIGGGGYGFQIAGTTPANGQILFEHGFSGTVGRWRTNPGTISLNSWQNIVVTYDNSSASNVPAIYINGIQQSLIFSSTPVGTASSDAAQNLVIGNSSNASDRTFDGQIDELQISSTIRSSDWVTQQYRTIVSASTTSASVQSRPTGLLLNDTDDDSDPLTVTLVSGPAHTLSFTLNTDGSFTYQHNGDFVATDSFTYQLSDGQGGVSTASATLAIQWTNTPPTISAISDRAVAEDTASGSIAFTIGDLETSTNALVTTVSSSNQSLITNAGIVLGGTEANRSISFTPLSNATGTAVITVTVDDGSLTAIETFNVIVNPVDDAPTISFIAAQSINEDTSSGVITFTIGDSDSVISSLIVTAASNRQSLIANSGITLGGSGANRTISFTPKSDKNGSAVVQITVDDGTTTTTRNFSVTVDAVNDTPIAVSDSLTAEQSAPTIIRRSALLANDIEQDGDSLIIEVVGQPSFGTLDLLPDGNLRYQHTASGTTSDSFTYRVFDGVVWSNPVGVSLSISSLPPPGFILVPGGNSIVLPSQNDSGSDGTSTEPSQSDSKSSDTPAIEPKKDSKPIAASLAGMVIAPGTQSLNDQAKESESGLMMVESNTSLVSPRKSSERAVQIDGTVSDRGRSLSLPATQGDKSAMMSTTIST